LLRKTKDYKFCGAKLKNNLVGLKNRSIAKANPKVLPLQNL